MADEFTALVTHGTWQLVPKPPGSNLIGYKWAFQVKQHPDGMVERFKVRLVPKGFNQRPRVDYTETFSHVVKPSTIRLMFSLTFSNNWCLKKINVNNAFLHNQLKEKVFIKQSIRFIDQAHPHHVYAIQKSIYGLKQAPKA